MSASIVILGSGGHAISVANIAHSCNMSVIAFVDENQSGSKVLGIPVISKQQCIDNHQAANFAIAIGDNSVRELVYYEYKSELPTSKFPALMPQSAVIGIKSEIGDGSVIMPQANVGPNSNVDLFCILNTSSSIDHDCDMKSFSSIAPSVTAGGNVKIGIRSALSIGTIVKNGMIIGDDVVIGANSYVNKAIDSNIIAYGSPCKFVQKRIKGDTYLS